jgi:hypothetical protein
MSQAIQIFFKIGSSIGLTRTFLKQIAKAASFSKLSSYSHLMHLP